MTPHKNDPSAGDPPMGPVKPKSQRTPKPAVPIHQIIPPTPKPKIAHRRVKVPLLPEQEVADMAFIATVVTIGILGIIELPIALVIAGTKILADQKHFRSLAAAARGVEEAVG